MANTMEAIDARIEALQQEIHQLRKNRNALSRLCTLPAELFVHIVGYIQRSQRMWKFESEYDGRWARMMLVCAHFRAIILDARALWAVVDCRAGKSWMQLCQERAGDMALHLLARTHSGALDHYGQIAGVADRVITRLSKCRVAELEIHGDQFDSLELLQTLEKPAPFMEILEVNSYRDYTLTSRFLGGRCDTLRSLTIEVCLAGINNPPVFPLLHKLRLDTGWISDILNMEKLLDFIAPMRLLRRLVLTRDSGRNPLAADGTRLAPRAPFMLPDLHTLHLSDLISHIATLLRLLPDPSHHLEVHVRGIEAEHLWSPPSNVHFTQVHVRLHSFWMARTGQAELPKGVMRCNSPYQPSTPGRCHLSFRSGPTALASLVYWVQCSIHQDDPFVHQVKTLFLEGDRSGPGYGPGDESGASFLSGLERVVLAEPTTAQQLKTVEKWVKQHAKNHRVLAELEIKRPAEKLEDSGKTEDFVRRLRKAGAVVDVTVTHPVGYKGWYE